MPTSERDQRLLELSTGFALGELEEAELREFYEVLRDPDHGSDAARQAWETLGLVVDLRSELGSGFQDTLAFRLHKEAGGTDSQFETRMRARIGASRPRLQPVAEPAPVGPGRRTWLALVAIIVVVAGIAAFAVVTARPAPTARVAAMDGTASQDGHTLTLGSTIDRRQVVVPSGSRLTLAWVDGSEVVLVGPASAVAGPASLSLLSGQIWLATNDSFTLGLPDSAKPLTLQKGTRCSVEIRDSRSLIGVAEGSASGDGFTVAAGQAATIGRGESYAWSEQPLAAGAIAAPGAEQATWRLSGTLAFEDTGAGIVIRCERRQGPAVVISAEPGRLVVSEDGQELQRLTLGGAPLVARQLLAVGDGADLALLVGGQRLVLPLRFPIAGVSWQPTGKADLEQAVFATGPQREPDATR
ncbi:MAG: hypothetical protein H0W72_10735 [Planctomycetes bacterium]|nr:hypothetical protein [Planctomycetota bacterium]